MEKRLFLLLSVVLLFVFGCEKSITPPTESVTDQKEVQRYQEALAKGQHNLVTEYKLRAMAQALAKSLENPSAGLHLKQKISERFDGDYNVLWKDVKDHQLNGKGKLRALVGNRLSSMIGSMADIETISNLQIALPMGTESWDGITPIKVAYNLQTIDDTELEYIPAFDSNGNEYKLDADTHPDYPVLVVSLNERTDNNGKVIYHGKKSLGLARQTLPPPDGGGGGGGGSTNPPPPPPHDEGDWEILEKILISDDYEPWTKGKPEIVIVIAGTVTDAIKYEGSLGLVNDENKWYNLDLNMFHWWTNTWGRVIACALFEADFGSYTITGLIPNEYVEIKAEANWKDNWDKYGQTMVDFRDYPGSYDLGSDATVNLTYSSGY